MKLSIDSPCHEDWDRMIPNVEGAFCQSCQKHVVDFSTMGLDQIKSFFEPLPSTGSICGRFRQSQLEAMSFDDFFRRFRRWHVFQKLAVICFFVFGSTLFSCSPVPEKDIAMGNITASMPAKPGELPIDTPVSESLYVLGGPKRIMPDDTPQTRAANPPMIKGEVSVPAVKNSICQPEDSTPVFIKGKIKRP